MAGPPPNPNTTSNLLSTHRALLDTLSSFFTVTTHHILFLRRLYPPVSFLSARAYNYPVRQSRHPAVCRWINDAVAAIRDQLEKNTVEKVSLCIYECDENRVLERWTFDLRSFPAVAKRDRDVPFESSSNHDNENDNHNGNDNNESNEVRDLLLARKVNVSDLESNFRATLSRISTSAAKLTPLPEGPGAPECSFTLTIEVKDKADRPVGRLEREERKWIAAEPEPFDIERRSTGLEPSHPASSTTGEGGAALASSRSKKHIGSNDDKSSDPDHRPGTSLSPSKSKSTSTSKTHPIRRLEAGELRMEVWVEESAAKFHYHNTGDPTSTTSPSPSTARATATTQQRRLKMSYGAGTEKFNPEQQGGALADQDQDRNHDQYQYDLEPADVNRKPQGGSSTDYQRG